MFSLPFLNTSPTPSLTYKTDTLHGLARLYTEPVPATEHRYYAGLVTHFTTSQHVFDFFSIKDVRLIRERQPGNLGVLTRLLVRHLEALRVDEEWLGGGGGSGTGGSNTAPRDRTKEALNCARLLARILPVLMEVPEGAQVLDETTWTTRLEEDVLWAPVSEDGDVFVEDTKTAGVNATPESEEQFVIDDEQESDDNDDINPQELPPQRPPLTQTLLTLTLQYLFLPGFTLPVLTDSDSPYVIWTKGVGSSQDVPHTTRQHTQNRIEFLRLLLVLLSKATYVPPPSQEKFQDRALEFVCTSLERTVVLPILCSLLNTACAPVESQWTGGWGGTTPTQAEREALRGACLQVLVVLLLWKFESGVGEERQGLPSLSIDPTETPPPRNTFTHWLSKIHRPADLALLSTSLFDLLKPSTAGGSLFNIPFPPPAVGAVSSDAQTQSPEAMTLLWILLRSNAKFRSYILSGDGDTESTPTDARSHTRGYTLLTLLLTTALTSKDTPSTHGLLRLSLFILQEISSNPTFSSSLSLPQSSTYIRLPNKFSTPQGTTASDTLLCTLYALLTTKGTGSTNLGLHPVILLTLCNTSPYFINLSIAASTRLSLLLTQFSSAQYLLADEGNPRNFYFLLEAVNNVLLHNADRNTNVVYALLGKDREVKRLRGFTLRTGVAEMRRRRGVVLNVNARVGEMHDMTASANAQEGKERLAVSEVQEGTGESKAVDTGHEAAADQPVISKEDEGKTADKPAVVDSESAQDTSKTTDNNETPATKDGTTSDLATASTATPSQKALGKTRQTSNDTSVASSDPQPTPDSWVNSLSSSELTHTASTLLNLSSNWTPTETWVSSWQPYLALEPLETLHRSLLPEIETLDSTDTAVLSWLKSKRLGEEVFPDVDKATTPTPRSFKWTAQVHIWLSSFIWGAIYVHYLGVNLWPEEAVKLFYLVQSRRVGQAQTQTQGSSLFSPFSAAFGAVFGSQQQQTLKGAEEGGGDAPRSTSTTDV